MVRTPIIPHVNDSVEHIAHILKFLKEIGITKYALLPFHQYGKGKYCSLGYKYSLDKLQAPSDGDIAVLRELIRSQGLSQDYEIQL